MLPKLEREKKGKCNVWGLSIALLRIKYMYLKKKSFFITFPQQLSYNVGF
jgi:hypothetical protein